MLPGYTGGKILWLRQHEPQAYERMARFVNPKDYIRLRLTGELATEVSDASGTGLFDVRARAWSRTLFTLLDIPLEMAPTCYESVGVSGTVRAPVAEALGLPKGVPVVGGGGDAVIQTLGTGVTTSDVLMTTIGTAGIISTAYESFRENPQGKLQVFCNVIPGRWHAMGVTLAAGGSLAWALEVLGGAEAEVAEQSGLDAYELISREAEKSSVGAGGHRLPALPDRGALPARGSQRAGGLRGAEPDQPQARPVPQRAGGGHLQLPGRERDLQLPGAGLPLHRHLRRRGPVAAVAPDPRRHLQEAGDHGQRQHRGGGLRRGPGGRGGAEGLAELRNGLPAAGRSRPTPPPTRNTTGCTTGTTSCTAASTRC